MADEPFNELIVFSTPGIWVGEVSWLKADFSGDRNTYVPRPIQVISELITGIVTIDNELIEKVCVAFEQPNKSIYEITSVKEVREFLTENIGMKAYCTVE